jgi:hypothetical protein
MICFIDLLPADAGRVKAARANGGDSNTGRGGRGRAVAAALGVGGPPVRRSAYIDASPPLAIPQITSLRFDEPDVLWAKVVL